MMLMLHSKALHINVSATVSVGLVSIAPHYCVRGHLEEVSNSQVISEPSLAISFALSNLI